MKNVRLLVIAVVLVSALILSGCSSSSPTPAPTQTSAPTTKPTATSTAPSPTQSATSKPTATSSPATGAQVIKLRHAEQNPANGWAATHASLPWIDQVQKATNGRVQFETYFSETLCKGPAAWETLKNGVADTAWCFQGYWANVTPLSDVIALPLMPFKSAKQAGGILWQLMQKYPTLAAQYKDVQPLLTFASTPYFLITNKKQVKVMDDMKGLKLRVTAGPPIEMTKLLNAVPVPLGMPDTYLNLQKGVVDGMGLPWEALLTFRQYEVVKYYTYFPMFSTYFTISMNKDKWNSIPKDVQDQIMSVSGIKGSLLWGDGHFDSVAGVARETIKKQGLEMVEYTLPDDELAKWTAVAGKPLWDKWVADMTKAGYPEAKDILATTLDLIKSYNPTYP